MAGKGEEEQQSFIVHKDYICSKSPFFVAATSNAWEKGKSRTVNVPEIEPRTFELYVHWIYNSAIDIDLVEAPTNDPCKNEGHKLAGLGCQWRGKIVLLLRLYVAADFLSDSKLKDEVISRYLTLRGKKELCFGTDTLHYVWDNTKSDSPLRRCIVDSFAVGQNGEIYQRWLKHLQCIPEFLSDLCARLLQMRGDREEFTPTIARKCRYHEHANGEKCGSDGTGN